MEAIDAARAEPGVWKPSPVEVDAPDPAWPHWYGLVRDRAVSALGDRGLAIEHAGSADEDAWPADLESAGFELRSRIP